MEKILLEKIIVTHLANKRPNLYGNRRFTAVYTTARHRFLFWARWIQFTNSRPVSLTHILKVSYHLHLGLPSAFPPSDFSTTILYAFLIASMRVTCPASLIILDLVALIIVSLAKSTNYEGPLCANISIPLSLFFLLGPSIRFCNLLSYIHSVDSTFTFREQDWQQ
jgi:hypothetical protein